MTGEQCYLSVTGTIANMAALLEAHGTEMGPPVVNDPRDCYRLLDYLTGLEGIS